MSIKFLTAWPLSLALGAQAQLSPGMHSPNSPFAPLPERADVLPEEHGGSQTKTPVKYSLEPVTAEGEFAVLDDAPMACTTASPMRLA
jgi:hypothetical protein